MTRQSDVFVFFNPSSGRGTGARRVDFYSTLLEQHLGAFDGDSSLHAGHEVEILDWCQFGRPGIDGVCGKFQVEPNPAVQGQSLQVRGDSHGKVFWKEDGASEWHEVQLDAGGNATVNPPAGTTGITFSDRATPRSQTVYVEVFQVS